MIEAPQILRTEDQPCAIVHLVVPSSEIQQHMGATLNEIGEVLRSQGIPPAGPWFTHHYKIPDTHFDFDICIPTTTPIIPAGRVVPSVWPATTLARTVHRGSYSGLVASWMEFRQWMQDNGHTPAPAAIWERYTVNPNDTPNPEDWRTELNMGLVERSS